MLPPEHLTDDNPKVAGILAIAALAHDYLPEYGRLALGAVLPDMSDEGRDLAVEQIAEMLHTADDLQENEKDPTWAEQLRADWIGYAKQAARSLLTADVVAGQETTAA